MQDLVSNHPLSVLLRHSWQAGVLIVLVLAVQWALGRRISPRWRYSLWLLVVARLLWPWTIPSPVSLFNYLKVSSAGHSVGMEAIENLPATSGDTVASTPASTAEPTVKFQPYLGTWLPVIWFVGAMGLQCWMIVTHCRIARHVTRRRPLIHPEVLNLLEDCKQLMGVHVPVSLVETDGVDAPCLFGFLRPRLLLPPGFTSRFSLDELRHVFLHELAHIKRQDILLGWLTAFLQILHWFNPLVWLAFSRMRSERELACDALALSHAGDHENQPYGRTMVKLLESFGDSLRSPSLAGIVEGKNEMKERIRMIAKFQKSNRGAAWAGVLFICLGVLTLTDAQSTAAPANNSAAPKIVKTKPAAGEADVSPSLKEIVVTFDRDMGEGYSWTGSGPDYPASPKDAKPHWRNKRTCVLPVALEPGHYYRVGINSKSFQNFRGADDVPAQPSVIFFTTKGAGDEVKARLLAPHVVTFRPENGANGVDPAVAEVRVTFDLPMGGGFSWCTAGDDDHDFPKGRAGQQISWTDDKKTCVMPVALQPGTVYRISLNAAQFKNFQSDAGVPLEPVMYSFATSGTPLTPATSGQ